MKRFGFIIRYLWVLALVWLGGMTLLLTPHEARVSTSENRMLAAAPELSFETISDGSFTDGTEEWLSDGIVLRDPLIGLSRAVETALRVPSDEDEEAMALIDAIEAEMNEAPAETIAPSAAPQTEAPQATVEPQVTSAPQTAPAPTAEPIATETPQVNDAAFWLEFKDGKRQTVFEFPAANIVRAAEVLNAYRAVLPEDGNVVFLQVPVASMGNAFLNRIDRDPVWRSDLEDSLQRLVSDGVVIVKVGEAMNAPLKNGEYVYFRTDHHWTARGAYYAYRAAMETLGVPAAEYSDYTYFVRSGMRGNNAKNGAKSDTLEVMYELLPTKSYVVSHLTDSREIPFMDYDAAGYLAFIRGTQKPWRRFETGARTGRTALLIGDSFSNAFLPYLLPHYDRVMMTDLRYTSYDPKDAGASVSEYIERYGVDEVYFVLCLATSINSEFFTGGQVVRYLH